MSENAVILAKQDAFHGVRAPATLLAAMVSIQYGAVCAKGLFPTVGAVGTTSLRLCVGAVLLCAALRPWRLRLTRRLALITFGYGAVLAAMNSCFYLALRTVPLGVAVTLEFCGPLGLAALASRRPADLVWIALAVVGVLLLSPLLQTGRRLDGVGVLFALAAGAFWALYVVLGQAAGRALGTGASALGTLIAALLVLPLGLGAVGLALFRPAHLWPAVLVGVFSSALPFALEMAAMTRLPTRVYGVLTALEPALGALIGWALLRESLGLVQGVGIAAVVCAAVGSAATGRGPAIPPE